MKATVLFVVFLLALSADALDVLVKIEGIIDGYPAYFRYDNVVEGGMQHFLLNLENSGSVSCKVRARFDVIRDGVLVSSAWSPQAALTPGDNANLEAYWSAPDVGEYSVNTSIHYCYFVYPGPSVNFSVESVLPVTAVNETPMRITATNTGGFVEFRVKSSEQLPGVVVIPSDYPLGWVFESGVSDSIGAGKSQTIRVPYDAMAWYNASIRFDVHTTDGQYHITLPYNLQEPGYSREEKIMYGLAVLCSVLIVLVVVLFVDYRKRVRGGEKSKR